MIRVVLLILLCPLLLFAQNNKEQVALNKKANQLFKEHKYKSALKIFQNIDSLTTNNHDVKYKVAICNLNIGYKSIALKQLQDLESKSSVLPIDYEYNLGKALHLNYKFDEAILHFNKYKTSLQIDLKKYKKELIDVERKLEICVNAKQLFLNPIKANIKSVGEFVNSIYPEYTPIVTSDETKLYFTSRRPENIGGEKDASDDDYFEDIYVSEKSEIGWGVPKNIGNHINTKNHDAVVSINSDGQTMIIYKHVHDELHDEYNGNIFYSQLQGANWSSPVAFDNNINTKYWEPSGSLDADEQVLFFSSDMPGGYGGTDIYVSTRHVDGTWGKPKNLGSNINTPYNDDAPHLMPDGKTLYFSSEGHKTLGGHDLFVTVSDAAGNWNTPRNLGYPINTTDDDVYASWSADGKRIYFSAYNENNGKSSYDIFVAELNEKPENVVVFKGKVVDKNNQLPMDVKITTTDLQSDKIQSVHHSNAKTGEFLIIVPENKNFKITIEKNGYLFQSFNLHVPENKSYLELVKDIELDTIVAGRKTYLRNVFFANNEAQIKEESYPELQELISIMDQNPQMFIEIVGNIDDINDSKHNKFLSESRATAIQEYLVFHGIDEKRILPMGFNSELVTNNNIEQMLEHLEVEVKIISNVNANYSRDKVKPNHYTKSKKNLHNSKNIEIGQYLHESIYFPLNESKELHKISFHKLQNIIGLLNKHPNLKLRIEAHYDQEGDVKHNLQLATDREKIVFDELVKLGVDPKRLTVNTYTDQPSENLNAIHESKLSNRKIKFKVVGN